VPAAPERCEVWAVSPVPLADPVLIDLGAGEASEPEFLFDGTAREVGLRFPEGVNVVIAAALDGTGLDASYVRVMRSPRGSAGRTMGFTVRSWAGVFELMARPRVVRAEGIHTVAASPIAMLRREAAGIVIG
jgi:predicted dinucleotide-utilizing enzyme